MKRKIEIGGSNFEEYITKNTLLVDKTLLIQEILDGGNKVLLITRPRRWGKTLNMSMLNYFFSISINADGSVNEEKKQEKINAFSRLKIQLILKLFRTIVVNTQHCLSVLKMLKNQQRKE